jgi:hypothetical protein
VEATEIGTEIVVLPGVMRGETTMRGHPDEIAIYSMIVVVVVEEEEVTEGTVMEDLEDLEAVTGRKAPVPLRRRESLPQI